MTQAFTKRLRRMSLLASTALVATTMPAGMASAQEPDQAASSAPRGGAADIVVTAQKREQRLNDVGLAVTAIGGEALQNRQISSLTDIASAVPGLVFSNSASNTPVYTLRGVGFNDTTLGSYPDVSVYLDEAPLPFPVMTKLVGFDLERLEVLRGHRAPCSATMRPAARSTSSLPSRPRHSKLAARSAMAASTPSTAKPM